MKQIRFNIFETNSSSTHSFTVSGFTYCDDCTFDDTTEFDFERSIGYRDEILNTPFDKAYYLLMYTLCEYKDSNEDEINSIIDDVDEYYYEDDEIDNTTRSIINHILSKSDKLNTILDVISNGNEQIKNQIVEQMCDNFEFSNFEQDLSGFYLDWFYKKRIYL